MKDLTFLKWSYSSSSSGGTYLKSETGYGSKKVYYKLSDFKQGRFTGCEAVIEVVVSRLGEILGFPVLKYMGDMSVIDIDGTKYTTFVARSYNYVKNGYTAIPLITDFLTNRLSDRESPLEYCRRIGLQEYLDYIFIFDYLIVNIDRHGHNIEILYNNDNDMIPSPIFDNGRSLTYEYGNNVVLMQNWDYKSDIAVNNFVGSIHLESNLKNISKPYKLPRLADNEYKKIFYGLGSAISAEHQQIIRDAVEFRYNKLLNGGIIL